MSMSWRIPEIQTQRIAGLREEKEDKTMFCHDVLSFCQTKTVTSLSVIF